MKISSNLEYHEDAYIIDPESFEVLFFGNGDGPKIERSENRIDIDTKTHEIKIDTKSGEILVRKHGWRDLYPVDDSIFGVVDTDDNHAK
jgi:hypothetical protein